MLRSIAIKALWWEWTFVSCILDVPRSRAQNFLKRKARARNLLCSRWQSERESAGAYYRNRKREAKDFEKVVVVSKHMTKSAKCSLTGLPVVSIQTRFDKNLFSRLVNCFAYLAKGFFLFMRKLFLKWPKSLCNFTAWFCIETTGFHWQ